MIKRGAVLCVLAGLPSFAQNPTTIEKGANVYSVEKESALGKRLAAEFREHTTAIASPSVQLYIENLGQELASQMPKTAFSFTFRVVAEDPCPTIHEPAPLPGGYVFVPAALFLAAQDEAEFAGMLAHAMAHVVEHHGTQQATPGKLMQFASIPVDFNRGIGCASGLAVPVRFLEFQRTLENEADLLAVQTMALTEFDPNALVRYTGAGSAPGIHDPGGVFSPATARRP
jgi:beta-barrel assembly-enhancing protease